MFVHGPEHGESGRPRAPTVVLWSLLVPTALGCATSGRPVEGATESPADGPSEPDPVGVECSTAAGIEAAGQRVSALLDEAQRIFDRDLALEPVTPMVDEALALVERCGIEGTSAARAYAVRSMTFMFMGDEPAAWEMFKRAQAIDPDVGISPDQIQTPSTWPYSR